LLLESALWTAPFSLVRNFLSNLHTVRNVLVSATEFGKNTECRAFGQPYLRPRVRFPVIFIFPDSGDWTGRLVHTDEPRDTIVSFAPERHRSVNGVLR